MIVASWNVNSINARLEHVSRFLQAQSPDVLLLQELKGTEFPAEHFRTLGYQSAAVTQKSYNGVAILSRLPLEMVSTVLPGDDADTHARFLQVIVDTAVGERIRVAGIYLPNGNPTGTDKFLYKLAWMDRLIAQLALWRDDPVPTLIGGDFNVIPEDIDCDKPANWVKDALFQPETRERYRAMQRLGFADAFRTLHPDATGQFTYWDYFRDAFKRNRGIRIDHFLLSPALLPRLSRCEIDRNPRAEFRPSDHTPILVELA